jgi:hypothetical protein
MKIQVTACDRCGKRDNGVAVDSWSCRRGTRRYAGDLCEECWNELVTIYQPSTLHKGRHQIVVSDPESIPKNS